MHSSMPQQQTDTDHVWYLGYGSNMNPAVLSGRRNVYPKHAIAVRVPDYQLDFTTMGMPYVEPAFGSISKLNKDNATVPELHAVAFYIQRHEFAKIVDTEGLGYNVAEIDCTPITQFNQALHGTNLTALTLIQDKAYQRHSIIPSRRYLNLLIDGAKHYDLPTAYQVWLQNIRAFRVTNRRLMVARVLIFMLVIPVFFGTIAVRRVWARFSDTHPPGLQWAMHAYLLFIWSIYHHFAIHIFGNGGSGNYLPESH